MTTTTTARAQAEFEAQGEIAPGTKGWWKVWGARPADIRPGDLLATQGEDAPRFDLILDTFAAKAAPVRLGFVNAEGEIFTLGALHQGIFLLRRGTHNILP